MTQDDLLEELFPDLDYDELHYSKAGYLPVLVSVFDHILTAKEVENIKHMTFSDAHYSGAAADYTKGEESFLKLYESLMEQGVYVIVKDQLVFFAEMNKTLTGIMRNSLREISFMSAYFPGLKIRVEGSFDRTDIFLLRDKTTLPVLQQRVHDSGLFVIPAPHLM